MATVLGQSFVVTYFRYNRRVTWPDHVVCFLWCCCVLAKIYATATHKQLLPSGARHRDCGRRKVRSAV